MFTAARNDDEKDVKESAVHKARHAASTAAEELKVGARRAKNDFESGIGNAADAVREDLQDSLVRPVIMFIPRQHAEESMVTKVREKPVAAMLVAVGLGFLLSGILRRS